MFKTNGISIFSSIDFVVYTVCIFIETTIFPLLVYLILHRSKQMKRYRYYVLNISIWCFGFDLFPFLIRPSFMFPASCIVFQPIVPMSNQTVRGLLYVLFLISINMEAGVVWSLFYRYAQVKFLYLF